MPDGKNKRIDARNLSDDAKQSLREMNEVQGQYPDQLIADAPGHVTFYASPPSDGERRNEKLKQHLARQHQTDQPNPYDSLSDEEILRRLDRE